MTKAQDQVTAISADPVWIRQCRHGRFMILPCDRYVGRCLDLFGEYSEAEADVFAACLSDGAVALEVGANIGALTVPLARAVGPNGRVIAIEPQRAVFNVLCANLALNGLLNVEPVRVAVGQKPGRAAIPLLAYGDSGNFGGVSLGHAIGGQTEDVPMISVDHLNLDRLNFLKIDVEGAEMDVLAGANDTIARCRPMILIENDRGRDSSHRLVSALMALQYDLWWLPAPMYRANNFRQAPDCADQPFGKLISINLLAVPSEMQVSVPKLDRVTGPDQWIWSW